MRKNVGVTGFAIVALLAAGAAPTYAQSTTTDKSKSLTQEAKTELSDSWITSKTKIALFADERVKVSQVHVETQNGTVMLRGKVDSNEAKVAAGEVTKGLEGVKRVKNELQVVAPTNRKTVDADDKQITKNVEERFKQDSELKNARIDAKVNAGVVTLTGEVKSIDTSARASEVARNIPGVRFVRNDLTYASRTSLESPGVQK